MDMGRWGRGQGRQDRDHGDQTALPSMLVSCRSGCCMSFCGRGASGQPLRMYTHHDLDDEDWWCCGVDESAVVVLLVVFLCSCFLMECVFVAC